ncbi:Rne/Rng family ribonuclease [candidate division FCPU426 bacterium]|nr:Rne/Rng family ribonuclease [candidate division FCPU426 bacterium]
MRRKKRQKDNRILVPLFKPERRMIITLDDFETRIAFLEAGKLAEYYYERNAESSIVGNIYKAKVSAVLPGLQAAFVDIGLEKSGFLHVRDIMTDSLTIEDFMSAQQARKQEDMLVAEEADSQAERARDRREHGSGRGGRRQIQDLLQKGQEITVQVEKASISTKGPRLTGQISLPSRLLVLIPGAQHTGVSHRIAQEKERSRLKNVLDKITPKGFGVIARTSAENAGEKELRAELKYLVRLWKEIKTKEKKAQAPVFLHVEQGLLHRVARDMLTEEDREIIIDAPRTGKQIKKWLDSFLFSLKPKIEIYRGKTPLFEANNIESELEKILKPKVWLKCGGYLVIEETEALVVVDVNTGRNVGKAKQDETILKTNLEAAQEIGRQLRLRDLGGIIVIDFIDMRIAEHKERVYQELSRVVQRDRAKTSIRKLTDLGLIEMTRKRVRGSLLRSLYEPCPVCQGLGWVGSGDTLRLKLLRLLQKATRLSGESAFILEVSPYLSIYARESALLEQARQSKIKLSLSVKTDLKPQEMRLVSALTNVLIVGND